MSIEIIDILKPKNGLSFKLIDDVDIAVQGYESLADAVSHFVTQSAVQQIINAALSGKQDTLSSAQLAACNSGITSELVTQIGTNTTAIAGKASAADLAATNTTIALKANSSDVNAATTSLQAQIDEISQTQGEGTADTEIAAARVDADGNTYDSLGSSIRGQIAQQNTKNDTLRALLASEQSTIYSITEEPYSTLSNSKRWFLDLQISGNKNIKSVSVYLNSNLALEHYAIIEVWEKNGDTLTLAKTIRKDLPVGTLAGNHDINVDYVPINTAMISVKSDSNILVFVQTSRSLLHNDTTDTTISYSAMSAVSNSAVKSTVLAETIPVYPLIEANTSNLAKTSTEVEFIRNKTFTINKIYSSETVPSTVNTLVTERRFFIDTSFYESVYSIKLYLKNASPIAIEIWELDSGVLTMKKKIVPDIEFIEAGFYTFAIPYNNEKPYMISVYTISGTTNIGWTDSGSIAVKYTSDLASNTLSIAGLDSYNFAVCLLGAVNALSTNFSNVIKVGADETYKSIQSACDVAQNGDTILINPGVYREQVSIWGKELHLMGVDKNNCILIDSSGDYITPPLEQNIGSVSNLTIIEDAQDVDPTLPSGRKNMAYCIHIDNGLNTTNKTMRVSNCILKNANRSCIGVGTYNNYSVTIENCEMRSGVADESASAKRGALYFHSNAASGETHNNQKLVIKNNTIECDDEKCIYALAGNSSGTFDAEIINNMVYSAINGKSDEAVSLQLSKTTASFRLSPKSYGNNIEALNY